MATFRISYIRGCKKKIMVIDEGRGLHGCKDFVSTSSERNGNKPDWKTDNLSVAKLEAQGYCTPVPPASANHQALAFFDGLTSA